VEKNKNIIDGLNKVLSLEWAGNIQYLQPFRNSNSNLNSAENGTSGLLRYAGPSDKTAPAIWLVTNAASPD
jgi:hypothetical protein